VGRLHPLNHPSPVGEGHTEAPAEDRAQARLPEAPDLLGFLWRTLNNSHFTLVLLIWLSAIIGLSYIIPQPPYSLDDPLAYSQWVASIPQFLWPLVEDLRAFGLFQLRTSAWLRLPLALLLIHALVMLYRGVPVAWKRTRMHHVSPGLINDAYEVPPALGRQLGLALGRTEAPGQVFRRVMEQLAQQGFNVFSVERAYAGLAWRWHASWWAFCSVYAGLAFLAVGLLLHSWLAQASVLTLQPGQSVSAPARKPLTLQMEAADIVGNPIDPREGVVRLRIEGVSHTSKEVALPLHTGQIVEGMWWTVVNIVPMVKVTASDAHSGEELRLWSFAPAASAQYPYARLSLLGEGNTSFASLPTQNITLRVGRATSQDAPPGHFVLSFFRGVETTPAWVTTLGNGDEVVFEGVRYQVSISYDVQLRIQEDWWWAVAALGWLTVAVGSILLTIRRPVWLVVRAMDAGGYCRLTTWVDTLAPQTPQLDWLRTLGSSFTAEKE